MAKNSVAGLLTSVDDLFSTQESRDEAKLERVINLPPGEISDFPTTLLRCGWTKKCSKWRKVSRSMAFWCLPLCGKSRAAGMKW